MKKTLILVRHGKACSYDAFPKDIDRVLTQRGVNDGYRVAKHLMVQGIIPELIYTSPAARASHTALIFARAMEIDSSIIQVADRLFHCSADCILDIVSGTPDEISTVMVAAHNPSITDLAYQLTSGVANFLPTTGTAVLEFEAVNWAEVLNSKASGQQIIIPRELS